MIGVKAIAAQAAPVLLLIGIGSMLDALVPGFSVPGNSIDWMVASVACAIVGNGKV